MNCEQDKEKTQYQNGKQDERLDKLEDTVTKIKDNHLAHIQEDLTSVKTDIDWLKRFFWIVATASIGSLIAAVINLLNK